MIVILLALLSAPALSAPPPERLLSDASRRVQRGDHEGALDRLEQIEGTLEPEQRALRSRLLADAHRMAALDSDARDPARHLTKAFEAHQACLESGHDGHAKQCSKHQDLLSAAIADRAGRLAAALELGGAVAPKEIEDRCTQLRSLAPDGPGPARCLARLAWAQPDASRAGTAVAWALPLPPSEGRDAALAQAAATLLHGLGDVPGTRELLARVPSPGPALARVQASLTIFEDKLAPRQALAHTEGTPAAWRAWLLALSEAKLFALALSECDLAVNAHPTDAKLLQTSAAVRTRAAAAVPKGADSAGRNRRIRALLAGARDDLTACAALADAPPACAASLERVQSQLDSLSELAP